MLDRKRRASKDEEKKDETLQEIIQTPTPQKQAASAQNGLHSTGNISDEPVDEEERPAKRARKDRTRSGAHVGQSSGADNDEQATRATKAAASADPASTAPAANDNPAGSTVVETVTSTRKSSKRKPPPSTAAARPQETRQLRSRRYPTSHAAKKPRPKTTMKLRKRPAVNNTASNVARRVAEQATGPVSNVYKEHRRSIDVGECEVCLHPYALSYLSKHRNKVHGLAHTTYGCPYCLTTFSFLESRLAHIQESHPGKPSHWTGCKTLTNVKAHLYACPLCPAHFTHSGLACHIGSSHHTSIDAFQVFIKCPFCLSSCVDGKQVGQFPTVQELKEHISKKHKGCFLLDDFKPPADRVFTRPGGDKPVSTCTVIPKKPPPPQESSSDEEEEQDCQGQDSSDEEHWERLDHNDLIKDYLYGDYVAVDFGMGGLDTAIAAVDDQLQTLQESAKRSADDDYIAELKLYNKGLKDRKQKADAERIEKERHREEVEKQLMEHEYENRNRKKKKRSAEEIEYDAFLDRPISFAAATRESARKASSCPYGEDCEICVSHDEDPETDSSGHLIDAPSCHTNVVGDSLNAAQSPEAGGGDSKGATGRSRRGRRVDSTTRSLLMLQEMKQSLGFVAEYNSGYFGAK